MAMKKIAALYIRVSTDFQAEEGYSIDAQKEQLAAYCTMKGLKDYEFYIDGGWSGSNIERPEIQRLIKNCEEGRVSHVVVFKLDRLSRSQKDTLYLIEDVFNPNGVSFVSLNESMDTATPMGRLMLGILSAFAQLERENIRLRTRMGMLERVKAGYWPGGGRVPYGYDYDSNLGILVPNKDAEKVKKMYELFLEGYSCQGIADMLGMTYDRLVEQVLKRKTNYGVMEYNGEIYESKHEPLISKEIFDMTMQEFARRSRLTPTGHYLLTGIMVCGKCGAKIRYQKWGKTRVKCVCYSQQGSKKYLVKDANCNQEKLWADEIETVVLKKVFSLKAREISERESPFSSSVLDVLHNQIVELEKKVKRLYNLYAETDDPILLETINENNKNLEKLREEEEIELAASNLAASKKRINTMLDNLENRWPGMTIHEQQTVIRTVVKKITLTGTKVDIDLYV